MSVPTKNYVLTEDVRITHGVWDEKIIMKGTFVRPIHISYEPKHVKEADDNRWFNDSTEEYCYTPIGIRIIPKNKIRET